MNRNMIRLKIETVDLLLFYTKKCQTLINQNHTKRKETFEFRLTQSSEIFSFKPPILLDGA